MKTLRVVVVITAVLIMTTSMAFARGADDISRDQSRAGKMVHKLGRGFVNFATGWLELPKSIADQWERYDPFTGFALGTVKGVVWGAQRTAIGVYEVATFPLAIPKDYKPLMEPEFILTDIWGKQIDLYQPE